MKTVGIIGAGIMANGMAINFLKNNYTVNIWNRTADKLKELESLGANVCDTPRAVTEKSNIVIECVSDDEASKAVWLGEDGIIAGSDNTKILATASSLSLGWTLELVDVCAQKNFNFIDTPLTGSRFGAENGKLKLLIGGEKNIVEAVTPVLEAISDKIYYFGPSGSGMKFKLVLNALQAIQMDAAAQAIELSQKIGLDVDAVQNAIFDAPMGAASGATKMAFDVAPDDHINFALGLVEKDLRYAKHMADSYGVQFNLLNDVQRDYEKAKKAGLADSDWSAITKIYQTNDG